MSASVPQMETAPSSVISIFTPVCFDDRIDGLSSLTNHITDLFRIDLDLNDLRCVLANISYAALQWLLP